MTEQTDQQLLRAFAGSRSEAAFAELVRRHVDLVYSAALRMVCDPHLAEDVTQGAFVALAKSAGGLLDRPVLSGWLHRTARNIAAQTVRTIERRRAREQEAAAMNELLADNGTGASPAWSDIAPHLDAALDELSEADRDALLLRYFERKSAREMAQVLGVSDEAAQKRVSRAVERLRDFFARRGVTIGASGLVTVISTNAVQAAPAGLAAAVSAGAVVVAAAVHTSTTLAATQTVAMTTTQKMLIASVLAAAIGTSLFEAQEIARLRAEIKLLRQQAAAAPAPGDDAALAVLQDATKQLTTQNSELLGALARAKAEGVQLNTAKQEAERSARLYKELADQTGGRDKAGLNEVPTTRHFFSNVGKFASRAAILKKPEDELTSEEKIAQRQLKLEMAGEMVRLLRFADELGLNDGNQSQSAEERADIGACMLYGALNLNAQQFSRAYGELLRFQQEATEKKLVAQNPDDDAKAALKQLNAQAEAAIRTLLTPQQAQTFQEVLPLVDLVGLKFNINF